jgi:hypothetical protein
MSRLPVTESSKEFEAADPSNSVTAERNRLMSWDSTVQKLTIPVAVIPLPKNTIILRQLEFLLGVAKLILADLSKAPYTLFKFGYEIAKLFTRGLSRIRFLLCGSKEAK